MEDGSVMARLVRRTARLAAGTALLAVALAPAPAVGQEGVPGRRDGRAQLEQRIRARFAQIVRERLGLTDEQSQQLGKVVEGFQGERRRLAGDENAVRQQVDSLLQSQQPSDAEARSLLDRMSDLREQEARLSRREQDSLSTVLSPTQLLRFNVMREEMAARIRQLGRGPGLRGRRMRGGGRFPPPGTMPAPGGFF